MKVYVTTKARPFQPGQYMGVYGSKKAAEKALRAEFPHMRKSTTWNGDSNSYSSDKNCAWILFIYENEV